MLRILKKYGGYFAALVISFLSIISEVNKPELKEGEVCSYIAHSARYFIFQNKELIGWLTIGIIVIVGIVMWLMYRPQKKFMNEMCSYIRRNIDLAPENEIQVSIFLLQNGWRTLLTYFKNLILVCFNSKYWKNGLFKIYLIEKLPNVRKNYYVRKEQSKTKQSFKKPTIYFQMTYAEEEQNGYLSYYMSNFGSKHINIDAFKDYKYTSKREDYTDDKKARLETYLSLMKLSFEDLRCVSSAANFIHIEPIVDKNNNYKGALVIDITHNTKIKSSEKYKTFIEKVAKIVNIAENNIE